MSRLGTQRFFDNFENGTANWNSGGEFNTSFYEGGESLIVNTGPSSSPSNALRMRTTNSGGNDGAHAQTNNNRYNIGTPTVNSDFIIRFMMYLPKRIGYNIPGGDYGFFNLAQFKGVGPGVNNPLHNLLIEVIGPKNNGGENYFITGYFGAQWADPPNTDYPPIQGANPIPIPREEWVEILIRTRVSDGDGIWQVWQDGVMIFDLRNQRTWRNDGGMDRLDTSINNYGRYHRGVLENGTWDGLSYNDVYVDDYGIYNLNPEWDYDLDQPTGGGGTTTTTTTVAPPSGEYSAYLTDLMYSYSMESIASLIDDSTNDNDGTNTDVTSVAGKNGNGYQYNGTSSISTVTPNAVLASPTTQVTLMVDMYPTAAGQSGTTVVNGKAYWNNDFTQAYAIGFNSSRAIRFRMLNSAATIYDQVSTGTLTLNQWSRVVVVYTKNTKLEIWINGIKQTFTNQNFDIYAAGGGNLTLGSANGSAADTRRFTGTLDNAMGWNRALTEAEIQDLFDYSLTYENFVTPPSTTTTTAGTTTTTTAGTTTTTTATPTTTTTTATPTTTTTTATPTTTTTTATPTTTTTSAPPSGEYSNLLSELLFAYSMETNVSLVDDTGVNNGTNTNTSLVSGFSSENGLQYNGTSSISTVNSSVSLKSPSESITIMADIYPTQVGQSGTSIIVGKDYQLNSGLQTYSIGFNAARNIRFRMANELANFDDVTSTFQVPLNQWSRVLVVYDRNVRRDIRINSTNQNMGNTTFIMVHSDEPLTIGSVPGTVASTRSFTGTIDNVMCWNRALTQQEINDIFDHSLIYSDFTSAGTTTTTTAGPTTTTTATPTTTTTTLAAGKGRGKKMIKSIRYIII